MRFEYAPPGGTWSAEKTAKGMTQSTFNGTHCADFVQNSLVSKSYETLPLEHKAARIPGYGGFVPGNEDVYSQRRAAATMHVQQLRPQIASSRGAYQSMELVDLRPQERSYNKNYIYAENISQSHPVNFMQFPTKKTFDHRRL